MIVLVCGGRDFQDRDALFAVLDRLHQQTGITKIVHGGAKGADTLGAIWGLLHGVFSAGYPAQWDAYGKRAGFIRNQEMIDVEQIDLVVACPGGNGTADMVKRATKAGIKIVQV